MYDYIMVRYGDLTLKGKNQRTFRYTLNNQLSKKLSALDVTIEYQHDLIYIKLKDTDADDVIKVLNTVSGLSSYSKVLKCDYDLDVIAQKSLEIIRLETKGVLTTFKLDTKRADKRIPHTSQELTQILSKKILTQIDNLKVDVHNPSLTLKVEVRRDGTYIYLNRIKGMGGFPVSIGGKGLVLLSGGIDSPVSAYLAMKKGLEVDCIHFESTPMTSIESAQKVVDLTEVLAKFAPDSQITLHLVPFYKLHEKLLLHIPEYYMITIMRRMMYRIASEIAIKHNCGVLISGDSIGQVASQTIESMSTIQDATKLLVIRPLSIFDKNDIVNIAEEIGTLNISNRPFSDCCTIYVPKNPIIKPTIRTARHFEQTFPYEPLVEEAVQNTLSVMLNNKEHLDIQSKGLTVSECLK